MLNEICRLCLNSNLENPVCIYRPATLCSTSQATIAKLIENLINIKVSDCDELPPNICNSCYETLEIIHKFQQKCLESYNTLLNMIDIKHCVIPQVEIKTEINSEILDSPFYDMNTENPAEEICVTNNIVKISDDLDDIDQYKSVSHSHSTTSTKSKPLRTYARKRSAPTTSYEYKWITKEKCSADAAKTLCTTCGALIRNESMEQHKNKHLGISPYQCTAQDCQKAFSSKRSRAHHFREIHLNRKYECDKCGAILSRKATLLNHIRSHLQPSLPCSVCGRQFRLKKEISKHMMTHTGERPYSCELCPKAFQNRYNLRVHMRVHSKERPFKCSYCNASFGYNSLLKVHTEKEHPKDKPMKFL